MKVCSGSIENISLSTLPSQANPLGAGKVGGMESLPSILENTNTHNLLGERDITSSGKAKDGTLPIEVS